MLYRAASKASNLTQAVDEEAVTFFAGGEIYRGFCVLFLFAVCFVLSVLCLSQFSMMLGIREVKQAFPI